MITAGGKQRLLLALFFAGWVAGAAAFGAETGPTSKEIEELFTRMNRAVDPQAKAATIKTKRVVFTAPGMRVMCLYQKPLYFQYNREMKLLPGSQVVYDGVRSWTKSPGSGIKFPTAPESDFIRFQAVLGNSIDIRDFVQSATLEHLKEDGREILKLNCQIKPELKVPPVIFYVDKETALVRRVDMKLYSIGGVTDATVELSDYQSFDGIMQPRLQVLKIHKISCKLALTECQFNLPIAPEEFKSERKK